MLLLLSNRYPFTCTRVLPNVYTITYTRFLYKWILELYKRILLQDRGFCTALRDWRFSHGILKVANWERGGLNQYNKILKTSNSGLKNHHVDISESAQKRK